MPYCPDCGTEIERTDSFCHECGAAVDSLGNESSKPTQSTVESNEKTSSQSENAVRFGNELVLEYSPLAWIGAIFSGFVTIVPNYYNPSTIFPLTILAGLAVPGYFGYKTIQDEPVDQTTFEVWTTILAGVVGIAAVELAGERGARILWKVIIAIVIIWAIVLFSGII